MMSPAFADRVRFENELSVSRQGCDAIRFPSSELRRYAARDCIFSEGEASKDEAYPVDSGFTTYSVLSGSNRAATRTLFDGRLSLACRIPGGLL
jgi:hypothetical protein